MSGFSLIDFPNFYEVTSNVTVFPASYVNTTVAEFLVWSPMDYFLCGPHIQDSSTDVHACTIIHLV